MEVRCLIDSHLGSSHYVRPRKHMVSGTAQRPKGYEKRYRAALVVLLGVYSFDRLSAEQKTKVEAGVRALLKYIMGGVAAHRRLASWDVRATYRAVAMARLKIAPSVGDLTWETLLPKRGPWRLWMEIPAAVIFSFYPMDPATADAKEYFRANGIDVPNEDPWERGTLDPVDGSGRFWKETGLRALLEKKRGRGAV